MEKDHLSSISHKLRIKRNTMRKTLKEMAVDAGVSYQTLSAYENRIPKYPNKHVLEKISICYDIPLGDLIAGDVKVEDEGVDYSRGQDRGKRVEQEHQHSDNTDYLLFLKGTGMYTIGDTIRNIMERGDTSDLEELRQSKEMFMETAIRISRRVDTKVAQQKKVL